MGKEGERKEASTAGQKHGAGGVSPPPSPPLAISSPAIEGKGAEGGAVFELFSPFPFKDREGNQRSWGGAAKWFFVAVAVSSPPLRDRTP